MLVFSCCKFNFGKSLSLYILQSKWRQIYTVLLYFPVCVCSSGWLLRPLWSCCWFLWNTLSPMHLSSSRPSTLWTIRKVTNSQYSTNTHTWLLIIMSQLVFLMITSSISMQLRLSLKALHCLRISPNVSSCLKLLFTANDTQLPLMSGNLISVLYRVSVPVCASKLSSGPKPDGCCRFTVYSFLLFQKHWSQFSRPELSVNDWEGLYSVTWSRKISGECEGMVTVWSQFTDLDSSLGLFWLAVCWMFSGKLLIRPTLLWLGSYSAGQQHKSRLAYWAHGKRCWWDQSSGERVFL